MITWASARDLTDIERLAATHQKELGFVMWGALRKAVNDSNCLVWWAPRGGALAFLSFYDLKRSKSTTLQYIVVDQQMRRIGVGRALVSALVERCRRYGRESIQLTCSYGLPANEFYLANGFNLESSVNNGKTTKNKWTLRVS
jgi:GNAT superfamily N-acetyltransferase